MKPFEEWGSHWYHRSDNQNFQSYLRISLLCIAYFFCGIDF